MFRHNSYELCRESSMPFGIGTKSWILDHRWSGLCLHPTHNFVMCGIQFLQYNFTCYSIVKLLSLLHFFLSTIPPPLIDARNVGGMIDKTNEKPRFARLPSNNAKLLAGLGGFEPCATTSLQHGVEPLFSEFFEGKHYAMHYTRPQERCQQMRKFTPGDNQNPLRLKSERVLSQIQKKLSA